MTPEERTWQIEAAIKQWQRKLRLQDWDVRLQEGEPPDGEGAHVNIWALRKVAVIRVGAGTREHDISRTVLHEMLHILLRPLEGWEHDLKSHVPPAFLDHLVDQARDETEVIIELLCSAMTGQPYISDENEAEPYRSVFA